MCKLNGEHSVFPVWRTAVEHYVGIDVSLELSSVCVVDGRGKIVKEAKVASEPEALVCFLKELGVAVNRIGLEAGAVITMAACRAVASRISNRSAGDAACEGGPVGDDSEDGPQGCVWACTAAADGMVPAGARQIDWIAGDPSAAGCAQAASRKVAGRGIEHSGNPARFRSEGRPGDAQDVRSADSGIGDRSGHVGAHC